MQQKRSNFSSKLGFVLAASGSAVGLGNIWRFPYLAAKYGGGTFLLIYLILAVTFGFSLMIAEIAIGRKTGLSAIGAFKMLDKRFGFLGILASAVPIVIFPYYSVIGGWVVKYFTVFISGGAGASAADDYFSTFISGTFEPLGWFFIFLAVTALIVLCGVEKGIEKVSKIMMPILVVLTLVISVYGLTREGAMEGLVYYIKPHMSDVSAKTILAAMGQLFYSMSLAMGIMVTYGSYMKKDNHLESSVRQIELFDTGIAFLAGLMIIPRRICIFRRRRECFKRRPGTHVHHASESIRQHEAWRRDRYYFLPARLLRGAYIRDLADGDYRIHLPGQVQLEQKGSLYLCRCAGTYHGRAVFTRLRAAQFH